MFFQKVLKGITGLSRRDAGMTFEQGILCKWWRMVGTITPGEVVEKLTERNLNWHLNRYDDPEPAALHSLGLLPRKAKEGVCG